MVVISCIIIIIGVSPGVVPGCPRSILVCPRSGPVVVKCILVWLLVGLSVLVVWEMAVPSVPSVPSIFNFFCKILTYLLM